MRVVSKLICILLLLLSGVVQAQKLLETRVDMHLSNITIQHFLDSMSKNNQIVFAYNPTDINLDSVVSINIANTSIRDVLNLIFNRRFELKEYNNYVLFLKKRPKRMVGKETARISGYLVNIETGEFINDASISELGTFNSTISNQDGFYKIELPPEYESFGLVISKYGFQDTVIVVDRELPNIDINAQGEGEG